MTKMEIERIHLISSNNREAVLFATRVSCYFCLKVSMSSEIKHWTDGGNTALCPNCEIDAIIPGEIPRADLEALQFHWFVKDAKA